MFQFQFLTEIKQSSGKKSKIQEETTNLALDQVKINLESTIQRAFTDAKAALKALKLLNYL